MVEFEHVSYELYVIKHVIKPKKGNMPTHPPKYKKEKRNKNGPTHPSSLTRYITMFEHIT